MKQTKMICIVAIILSLFCATTPYSASSKKDVHLAALTMATSFKKPLKFLSATPKNQVGLPFFPLKATFGCTLNLVAGSFSPGYLIITNSSYVTIPMIVADSPLPDVTIDTSDCNNLGAYQICAIAITGGAASHPATSFSIQAVNASGKPISNALTGSVAVNSLVIGSPWQGGTVYAIDGNVVSVAAISDAGSLPWDPSPDLTDIAGANNPSDGSQNTLAIFEHVSGDNGIDGSEYAAGICFEYQVDSSGNSPCVSGNTCYDQWYLPAIEELTSLFDGATAVGYLTFNLNTMSNYWSSTQYDTAEALGADFSTYTTTIPSLDKSNPQLVRCVRMGT